MTEISGHFRTWRTYQGAWEDVTSDERRQLLAQSVAASCAYADPAGECHGVEALAQRIERARAEAPGISFTNHTFRSHHGAGLASWTRFTGDGIADFTGTSYSELDQSGKLSRIVGFPIPVAAS